MAAKEAKGKAKADSKSAAKGKDEDAEEGGSGDAGAEGDAPKKKRLSGRTLVLFIILPIVLLLGGGATAHLMGLTAALFGGSSDEHEAVAEAPAADAGHGGGHGAPKGGHGGKPEPVKGAAVFFNLPEMVVNLNSVGKKSNYLKISISLELQQSNDISKIESVMPRIVDNFQTYLRELRVEDLRGSSGLFRLREELLSRVNVAAAPAKINDVLFKEMLVQ